MKSACDKVLSLSVDDPLMKILTGLELVLKKAQVKLYCSTECGHHGYHMLHAGLGGIC